MTHRSDLREHYAGLAMQALIQKMPLIDEDGELGDKPVGDMMQLKRELAFSAWRYADAMLEMENAEARPPE